ncbi:MAG: hypothetical protein H6838_16280 [Planctomycetes bacterium]|nr:hypothetical protein [Planctomycetota bacterium]MCB9887050.1 hypothetical protein [Planctomycetota bacterium]
MSLSDDLLELLLCKLRAGASVSATARAAGISRQRLYRAAEKHPELKALLPTSASTADEPKPATTRHQATDDVRQLTSFEDDLSRGQVADLMRSLHSTGNLARAALEAGVSLFPRGIAPRELPKEARAHLRTALQILAESRKPKPPSQEAELLAAWLNGSPWPTDIRLDPAAMRALSPRAADDLERHMMLADAERFANGTDGAAE